MAVVFDAVSSSINFQGVSTIGWDHTVGGSGDYIQVRLPWTSFPTQATPAPTYNSVAMTLVGNNHATDFQATLNGDASIYELPAPATGTKTIAAAFSGGNIYGGGAGSVSYTGVHQTAPCCTNVTTNNGTSTTPSTSVASTTANNIVGDCMAGEEVVGGTTPTANDTGRLAGIAGGGSNQRGGCEDIAAGGTVVLDWTLNNSGRWITVAAEIQVPQSAATAGLFQQNYMDGVSVGGPFFSNPLN